MNKLPYSHKNLYQRVIEPGETESPLFSQTMSGAPNQEDPIRRSIGAHGNQGIHMKDLTDHDRIKKETQAILDGHTHEINITAKDIQIGAAGHTINRNPSLKEAQAIAPNKLVFGIIPQALISDLDPNNHWKSRTTAIEEIEKIFSESSILNDLNPFISSFLSFFSKLILDSNFKISHTAIKIISNITL